MSSYAAAVVHLHVTKQQALRDWERFVSAFGTSAPQRLAPRQRRKLARRKGRGLRALRVSPFGFVKAVQQ